MCKIKIAIVDDHSIFREGIILVLNQISEFEVVFDTSNGLDFITFLETDKPDLVLMDVNMPIINGVETTKKALTLVPDLKVIALTMFSDLGHYTQMIEAGVKGFVIKNASKTELSTAIQTVFKGGNYFSQEILQKLALQSVKNKGFNKEQLTLREIEIIQLICQGKTTGEIAESLFISVKTVETHRSNIYKKAQVRNLAELIVWAVKNDYFAI